MKVDDGVLVARNASVLRCVRDNIGEHGIVVDVDGGREGRAGHAEVADGGGYEGGTDGTIGGRGVGFDEDLDFHSSMWCVPRGRDPVQGLTPLVNVVAPRRGYGWGKIFLQSGRSHRSRGR